jgi:hypothetical protein
MSELVFDGQNHSLSLLDKDGKPIGSWLAYNNVDSHATLRHLPNGPFPAQDKTAPHAHAPNPNGPYGSYGIIRFSVPGHPGVGVHSGRADARYLPGPEHPTMGCIRTSDMAMQAIKEFIFDDALATVIVKNNNPVAARTASAQHRHRSL